MDRAKLAVIPNPVHPIERSAAPDVPDNRKRFRIIAVGRLAAQKGFDDLIGAFADLCGQHPQWDLYIYGEGEERDALQSLARRAGADGRVFLPGWCADIEAALSSAHLMAFPSRYEGFPNALCEAAAAGLPLIGFTGVSGVEDIIRDGENGILIDKDNRIEGLRAAMSSLIKDASLRRSMGDRARLHIRNWSPEQIAGMWQSLFNAVRDPGSFR
jgi:glycosyltransferase involved in cell wall biosynthesis